MALKRSVLIAFCGVALVALTASAVAAEAAAEGQPAAKQEEGAGGGGYMNVPGQMIEQPTDQGADPAATDAAASESPADEGAEPAGDAAASGDLKSLAETLSAEPDFKTLVAAVSVAADVEGKKLSEEISAEGPFTAGGGGGVHEGGEFLHHDTTAILCIGLFTTQRK